VQQPPIPPSILRLAEQLLGRAFGGAVRLGLVQSPEGGSQHSRLLRCQVLDGPSAAPANVILKSVQIVPNQVFDPDSYDGPGRAFHNEWASLEFLTRLAERRGALFAPQLYGADRASGLLVMEDLGQGESLVQPLLGDDCAAAEAALDAYFRTLGRLGAQTHAHHAEYWQIRDSLGPRDPYAQPTLDAEYATLQRWLVTVCTAVGIEPTPGTEADLAEAARFNAEPGPFIALSQSDTCPDNCVRHGDRMRLLDFEWGWVRNALNDGARARSNFPTCWCVHRLRPEIVRRAETVYRAELVKGCPAAADDTLFNRELVKACATWTLTSFEFYNEVGTFWERDGSWGTSTTRQRAIARLELLAEATAEFGMLEALGATAAILARRLQALWPELEPMSLYPAFR
jgi:hypothetical protein